MLEICVCHLLTKLHPFFTWEGENKKKIEPTFYPVQKLNWKWSPKFEFFHLSENSPFEKPGGYLAMLRHHFSTNVNLPLIPEDQTLASWFDLRQGTLAYLWLGVLAWTGSKVLVALSPPWEPDPPQIPSNCSIPLLESFFWQQLLIFAPSESFCRSWEEPHIHNLRFQKLTPMSPVI